MSEIPQHVMKAAADAHADFAKSSVRDNLTTIIARAIAKAVEEERLRFEGDLDKWMKIIGTGITGYQPEAYAVMDTACEELVRLRTAVSEAEQRVKGTEYKYRIDYEYHSYIGNRKMWSFFMELSGVSLEEALEHLRQVNDNNPSKFRLMRLPVNKWEEVPEPQHGESE